MPKQKRKDDDKRKCRHCGDLVNINDGKELVIKRIKQKDVEFFSCKKCIDKFYIAV